MSVENTFEEDSFIEGFNAMVGEAKKTNLAHNFTAQDDLIDDFADWITYTEGREKFGPLVDAFRNARVGLKLMLAVSELGETLEAVRKNIGADEHIPEFTAEEAEIADAFIRLMNYSHDRNLRIAEAIVAKNRFNRTRVDHSPEGRATKHGKKF